MGLNNMANTYVALATNTLGTAASSVTFSSIPGTYTDLVLVSSVLTTVIGGVDIHMTFNSDTGSNYSRTYISGNGSSATSNRQSSVAYIRINQVSYPDNNSIATVGITNIQNYANSTTNKTVLTRSSNASDGVDAVVGLWRNTAAITTITLTGNGGNFAVGSTFSLYGILAA